MFLTQKTVKLTLCHEKQLFKLPKINLSEVVPGSYGDRTGSLGFAPRILINDIGIFPLVNILRQIFL